MKLLQPRTIPAQKQYLISIGLRENVDWIVNNGEILLNHDALIRLRTYVASLRESNQTTIEQPIRQHSSIRVTLKKKQ